MNPKLTARDIAVILSVYKCRYLTGTQIERLHFASKRPMWRRIQALLELGFIKSFTAPHIPERIFYLDMRIPRQSCHRFQVNPATDSRPSLPPIPGESCR